MIPHQSNRNFWTKKRHSTRMQSLIWHNRRLTAGLLILAFLVMALPSGASWQCMDGKPCDADCKMPHGATPRASDSVVSFEPHCSHCPTDSVAALTSISYKDSHCSCTTPQCVLRVFEHPASSLQEGMKVFAPMLALSPPAIIVSPVAVETASIATTYLCFYPQRFLRPFSGRAPPTIL